MHAHFYIYTLTPRGNLISPTANCHFLAWLWEVGEKKKNLEETHLDMWVNMEDSTQTLQHGPLCNKTFNIQSKLQTGDTYGRMNFLPLYMVVGQGF